MSDMIISSSNTNINFQHDCIFVRRGQFSKTSMEKQVKRMAERNEPVSNPRVTIDQKRQTSV